MRKDKSKIKLTFLGRTGGGFGASVIIFAAPGTLFFTYVALTNERSYVFQREEEQDRLPLCVSVALCSDLDSAAVVATAAVLATSGLASARVLLLTRESRWGSLYSR